MPDYVDEKRRRIEQFAAYLRLMGLRAHKIAKSETFIVFDESAPEDTDAPKIPESVAITANCSSGGSSSDTGSQNDGPMPEGSSEDPFRRFIQFAFHRDCFYLELPNNTVFPEEVEQIFRDRQGFFYARNRPDLRWNQYAWQDVVEWDPLQKVYLYRDEESAAEDMAFILYQVWKFPVDWPWYIRAEAFTSGHEFEDGKRLD